MSTRGLFGYVIDGETKTSYNHCDSYPSGLGNDIKKFIISNDLEKMKLHARNIKLVKSDDEPTSEDIIKYGKYFNQNVNGGSVKDYYALLRELQGDLQLYLDDDVDIMIDNTDFILDSLFCEWAYLINFDTNKLEIYKGFQKIPPKKNRYGYEVLQKFPDMPSYYPCELIREIPFDELLDFVMTNLEREFEDA